MKAVVQTCYGAAAVLIFCAGCLCLGFVAGQLVKAVLL